MPGITSSKNSSIADDSTTADAATDSVSTTSNDQVSDVVAYKTAQASKLSARSTGALTYQLGFVEVVEQFFVRIQSNETGGYFSKEWVPLEAVLRCLAVSIESKEAFSAAVLKSSFVSKSQNNAGFLAAVLKAEGLLVGVVDKSNLLTFDSESYKTWLVDNLALAIQSLPDDAINADQSNSDEDAGDDELHPEPVKRKTLSKAKAKKATIKKPVDTNDVAGSSTSDDNMSSTEDDDDAIIDRVSH